MKRLLIAYFIGNISVKKMSKSIHVCQSCSKSKVERFLRHGVFIAVQHKAGINMVITPCRFFEFIHDFDFGVARVQ